ncbi:MAG: PKD domain-containing protein [Thermoproteota archaeon]|nr:PKD domain-containing protein [Thermoproteota archaeon]
MRVSSRLLLLSPTLAIAVIAITIAIILLASSITTVNAQQRQQQSVIRQPSSSEDGATTIRSIRDSFRVQVPQGWIIHDVRNTGYTLAAEALEGYGILAQLCPEEQQQQQQQQSTVIDAGSNTSDTSRINNNSCQGAQEDVIHIIRYPNLGARLGISSDDSFTIINRDTIPNAILQYHMQKLQEVGYRNITIVNSIDTTIKVDNSTSLRSNRIPTIIPAKLVEITYSTNLNPNETRTGYFILTATVATPRNLGTITGYSIFYDGNSSSVAERVSSSSLIPTLISLPTPVKQVFDSFELIAARSDPLIAEITSDARRGVAPATFELESEVIGGIGPYTMSWNFGDGSSEENDEDDEHTIDIAGTYNVDLTVRDSTGRTNTDRMLVTVEPPPPLTAVEITSDARRGVAPATFEFGANVTGGTEPYTYSWNFGDGSVEVNDDEDDDDDDDNTVEHTFDIAGTYNVDLTVMDSTGRTVSDSILITIEEPPPLTATPSLSTTTPTQTFPTSQTTEEP